MGIGLDKEIRDDPGESGDGGANGEGQRRVVPPTVDEEDVIGFEHEDRIYAIYNTEKGFFCHRWVAPMSNRWRTVSSSEL